MQDNTLISRIKEFPHYQRLDLGNGVVTPAAPNSPSQLKMLEWLGSTEVEGLRVADIGCSNGLYALALARAGAKEVIAIDNTEINIRFIREIVNPLTGMNILTLHQNILYLGDERIGQFDLVVFGGLLYHLRFPFQAMRIIRDLVKPGGHLLFETAMITDFGGRSIVYCPKSDDSPYRSRGANSCSFFNERALKETLNYFGFAINCTYIDNKGVKLLTKRFLGSTPFASPVCRICHLCRRDEAVEDRDLREFYEGRAVGALPSAGEGHVRSVQA
jgi:SAM-dependent methyltransferase